MTTHAHHARSRARCYCIVMPRELRHTHTCPIWSRCTFEIDAIDSAHSFCAASTSAGTLAAAAIDLVKQVKYRGAGTVEFLVDEAMGDDATAAFMEVNPRLQVSV